MLNFHIYKLSHSYHHRFTLYSGADKEVVLPKPPSLNLFYLLQLFTFNFTGGFESRGFVPTLKGHIRVAFNRMETPFNDCCLLYTSPSPRDVEESRMPSSA